MLSRIYSISFSVSLLKLKLIVCHTLDGAYIVDVFLWISMNVWMKNNKIVGNILIVHMSFVKMCVLWHAKLNILLKHNWLVVIYGVSFCANPEWPSVI